MQSTCRNYRKTQLILLFDVIYPLSWLPMYISVNIVSEDNSFWDWIWRLFFGGMAAAMSFFSGRVLKATFKNNNIPSVLRGMLKWLAVSLTFCTIQWTANGILGYWGAFWITLILRFFMIIVCSLFVLDLRRLSRDAELLQNLGSGMQNQLSGSGSNNVVNQWVKCKIL